MENFDEEVRRILSSSNHFLVLNLPVPEHPSDLVDIKTVKKTYKQMALQVHPDKNTHPHASEAFKALSKAFEILSNVESQNQYTMTLICSKSEGKRERWVVGVLAHLVRNEKPFFSKEDFEGRLTRKRQKYEESQAAKKERRDKRAQQEREQFKEVFEEDMKHFDEKFKGNINAWKNFQKKGKVKAKPAAKAKAPQDAPPPPPPRVKEDTPDLVGEPETGQGTKVCWICLRKFPSDEALKRHEDLSQLHKTNLQQRHHKTNL